MSIEVDLSDRAFKSLQKAKGLLSKTASQAVDSMTETTDQVISIVAKNFEKAIGSTIEAAKKSVSAFTEATTETADAVVSKSIQGTGSSLIDEGMNAIKAWVDLHPLAFWITQVMLWAIQHPVIALIVLLLVVFTLRRLLKGLGLLVEKALISVLQAPLKLGRSLLRTSSKSLSGLKLSTEESTQDQQPEERSLKLAESVKHSQKERLASILSRLEIISQEQHQLLQEVAAIAASSQPPDQMSQRSSIVQTLKDS